jgi:ferredoxin-thioredoxin reductase catalytic subunit
MEKNTQTNGMSICRHIAHKEAELQKVDRCLGCWWRNTIRKSGKPFCTEELKKEFQEKHKGRCYAWWDDYAARTGNKMCRQE